MLTQPKDRHSPTLGFFQPLYYHLSFVYSVFFRLLIQTYALIRAIGGCTSRQGSAYKASNFVFSLCRSKITFPHALIETFALHRFNSLLMNLWPTSLLISAVLYSRLLSPRGQGTFFFLPCSEAAAEGSRLTASPACCLCNSPRKSPRSQ